MCYRKRKNRANWKESEVLAQDQGAISGSVLNILAWYFPGGPGAKTPHFQCRRPRFNPRSRNKIPHAATKTPQNQITLESSKETLREESGQILGLFGR